MLPFYCIVTKKTTFFGFHLNKRAGRTVYLPQDLKVFLHIIILRVSFLKKSSCYWLSVTQGWEFAHSLIRSFHSNQMSDCEWIAQVTQDKWATVSESIRLLMTNQGPWANRSGRSPKMSDHEQFAQVAHQKLATMSESLRLLTKNEPVSE